MKVLGIISAFLLSLFFCQNVRGGQLISDLSSNQIELRYSFTGSDLMLFGAIDHIGPADEAGNYDIVAVIRGPDSPVVVRKKDKILGIWMNNVSITYSDIPSYYAFASNKPIKEIASNQILEKLHLGISHIKFENNHSKSDGADEGNMISFKEGLIRNKLALNLYQEVSERFVLMNNTLFRSEFYIPSNVPVGVYDASVYLFKDGKFITSQETELKVDKAGFSRSIYTLAKERPAIYGIIAILIALSLGWFAGVVARD